MTIKTNLSFATLAKYSAMMYNHGEDMYTANGDNICEMISDSDEYANGTFVLDAAYLKDEAEYHINAHDEMNEENNGPWHRDYLEGSRDEFTINAHEVWKKERKDIAAFKRQYAAWAKTIETVPVWEYDSDTVVFISFNDGKAVPKSEM